MTPAANILLCLNEPHLPDGMVQPVGKRRDHMGIRQPLDYAEWLARSSRLSLITSQYQWPSPFGMIRNSLDEVYNYGDLIVALAARYRLPVIYSFSSVVAGGGLISYGPDTSDLFRRAASYVDRVLRGEKPSALPVQAPIRFTLAVNQKTAKTMGLTVPTFILLRADEVIG